MAILNNGKMIGESADETYHYLMEKNIEFAGLVAQYDTVALEKFCLDFRDELAIYNYNRFERKTI